MGTSQRRQLVVDHSRAGARLDRFLVSALGGVTRGQVARMLGAGMIAVNGRPGRKGQMLRVGDQVELPMDPPSEAARPDPRPGLSVVLEDDHLVVIDKPAGMPSHPLRAGERGSAASALLARYPEMAEVGHHPREPGLVHRLDNDTSGLLLAARDAPTFEALVRALRRGEIEKRYQALVAGRPKAARHRAFLDARRRRVRVAASSAGPAAKPIVSEILSVHPCGDHCLIDLRVHRAARHQVRAHLAFLGHPLYGDVMYGGCSPTDQRGHALHASSLAFVHPMTGRPVTCEAPLPPAFGARIALLTERVAARTPS